MSGIVEQCDESEQCDTDTNNEPEQFDADNEPEQCNTDNVLEIPSCNSVNHASEPISDPIEQSQCDENMQCSTHESPSDIAFTNMLKSLADKNGCSVL